MNQSLKKRGQLLIGLLSLLTFVTSMTPHFSALAVEQLFTQKQISQKQRGVREGQVTVIGDKGQYTGKMIVRASPAIAWAVLTDYDNYEKFLPDVAESQLLENNGNNKIFEQIKVIQAAIFSRRSKVRIAVNESYPQKIAFKMTSGEIKSLQGTRTRSPTFITSLFSATSESTTVLKSFETTLLLLHRSVPCSRGGLNYGFVS